MLSNEEFLEKLGDQIYRLRKNQKMTQDELAKLAGISQMTILRVENATGSPRVDNLRAISSALGYNLIDLIKSVEKSSKRIEKVTDEWDELFFNIRKMPHSSRKWMTRLIKTALEKPDVMH